MKIIDKDFNDGKFGIILYDYDKKIKPNTISLSWDNDYHPITSYYMENEIGHKNLLIKTPYYRLAEFIFYKIFINNVFLILFFVSLVSD